MKSYQKMLSLAVLFLATLVSTNAFADLPSPTKKSQQNIYGQYSPYIQNGQYNNTYNNQYGTYQYGQGYGTGASYYNNGSFLQNNNSLTTNSTTALSSASDLLWIFTGSDSSLKNQVKSGFHSDSSTSFGGRLLSFFMGMIYKRIGTPIANRLGAIENNALNRVSGVKSTYQNPYGQGNGAAYCYQCALQNSTNPYQRNQQAINPAIFNGTANGTTPSTTTRSGGVGGVR